MMYNVMLVQISWDITAYHCLVWFDLFDVTIEEVYSDCFPICTDDLVSTIGEYDTPRSIVLDSFNL